jgi:hypothetical protein
MRIRILSALGAAALLIGAAASLAPAATASPTSRPSASAHGRVQAIRVTVAPDKVLYDQNDHDSVIGISSQNFEGEFDAYDASSADDFKIPAGETWKIKRVLVTGVYYNGEGPADSETVTFYKDDGGLPGDAIKRIKTTGTDTFGSFDLQLGTTVKLKGGKSYWLGVVVNMDFNPGGQWGWETRTAQNGNPGAWENPGDGYDSGCTSWDVMTGCLAQGEGPDDMFTLIGK